MSYKFMNNNPLGKKKNDCVIRAISLALNKKWEEVARDMFKISIKLYSTQNGTDTIKTYLKDCEKINVFYINEYGKRKRYKVRDVCNMKGTYIISVANHLTCVKNGTLYDTWDCRDKSSYMIWKIE